MPPDSLRHRNFAPAEAAADYPDTVEFETDGDDLPTRSLESAELELVAPTYSEFTPDAADSSADSPQDDPKNDHEDESAGIAPAAAAAPPTESVREIGPGTVLRNRYLIEKSLGVGGGSTVFSAVDRHRTQSPGACGKVAVKVLHPRFRQDQARIFRLTREFRHMQRLTHAGIARVFDLDCDSGVWFITMELLEGQSLHRQLKDGLKEEEALRILTQCTEALAYAHDQGILHGDLKPGNIFITNDGSVRLLDFGSVPDQNEATATDRSPSHLAATLAYASPQLLEEKGAEPRDDLFSLGCVAYELFSGGQHPFDRLSSLEARLRNLKPPDIRTLPARRFAVISQMLAWERTARPADARDFLHSFLAVDFRPDGHVDGHGNSNSGDAVRTAAVAEPSAHTPGSMRDDLGSTDAAADTTTKLATNEQAFATFAGVVPEDWVGPGTRLPIAPKPPPAADPPKAKAPGNVPAEDIPRERVRGRENVRDSLARESTSYKQTHAAPPKNVGAAALQFWLSKTMLIALFFLLMVAGIVLTRLWQADPTSPAATAPTTAAVPIESAAKIAPATAVQEAPAPAPPVTKSPAPAAARGAPAAAPPAADPASLQSALVKVGSSQKMAVVNVVREKSTAGTARVAWSIVANTAKPGVDYESPDSQIAQFNDGQRVRSLYIPLRHPAAGSSPRPERRFTVKLQKAPGALLPGRIDRAEVVISPP